METKIKDALKQIDFNVSSTEEIKKQMRDFVFMRLDNFPLLKNLDKNLIERNIDKIYDYIYDYEYCKNCPGSKNCEKNNPLLTTSIEIRGDIITRTNSPCKEIYKNLAFNDLYTIRDFSDDWLSVRINNIDKTKNRLLAINKYIKYLQGEENNWIFINGAFKSGRSFLAAAITNDLASKNKGQLMFINSTIRFKELSDTPKSELQKQLNKYSECLCLVIDDFGNEYKNDFIRDGILFPILSFRASHNLLTIFTSDFTIKEICELYTTSKSGEIRTKQLYSLLKKMCGNEINLGEIGPY